MRKRLLLVGLLLNATLAWSNEAPTQVSFAVSNTIPPYFFANGHSGLQYDLLSAALATQSLTIKQMYLSPNKRTIRQVRSRNIDCLINAPEGLNDMFYTRPLIHYRNSVFTLNDMQFNIDAIDDLRPLSVTGFQNATKYLGEAFYTMAIKNPKYDESNSQRSQVMMLFSRRVDAIIIERRIFTYYRKQLRHKVNTRQAVKEHALFEPAPRRIACHDKEIAQRIDAGIQQLYQANSQEAEALRNWEPSLE